MTMPEDWKRVVADQPRIFRMRYVTKQQIAESWPRAKREQAKDKACKLGAAIIVGGFWIGLMTLIILEMAR